MTSLTASPTPLASASHDLHQEESARYALLRRIAPAIRHHMAGTLQPIGMISAIMERRLQAAAPDLNTLRESGKSISTLSRSAASACMNLITWVAPKENAFIPLQSGVEECVGMLATDLAFRGFTVDNQINAPDTSTSIFALRTVFTASLIALTDAARTPARVVISSVPAGGQTRVSITVTSEAGADVPDDSRAYRKLGWDDVRALAAAEQVSLTQGANQADMLFDEARQADAPA